MKKVNKINILECLCIIGAMILQVIVIYNADFLTKIYISGDMVDGHYAVWSSIARIWADGEVPLWNSYYWGGFSSVGHIFGVFYPILIILEKIFWNPVTQTLSYSILPMYIAIHATIFSAGIYCLNRVVGYSKSIALAICLFATFAGCTLSNSGWAYIFGGIFWIPLLLTFLYLMCKSDKMLNRYVFLSGIVLGLIILCSTSHGSVMAIIMYILFFFNMLWHNRKDKDSALRIMGKQFFSGCIGIMLGAVELVPFFLYYKNSHRFTETVSAGENNRLSLQSFTEHSVNNFNMNSIFGGYSGFWAICIVFLLLIIVGFFKKNNSEKMIHSFFKILLLWAIFYSAALGVTDVVWYIPFANGIRQPHLYIPFIAIGGSLLAASGLETIFKACSNKASLEDTVYHKNAMLMVCAFAFLVTALPHNIEGKVDFFFKLFIIIFVACLIINSKKPSKYFVHFFTCSILLLALMNAIIYMRLNSDNFYVEDANAKVANVNSAVGAALEEMDEENILEKTNGRILQWGAPNSYPVNTAGMLGYYDCLAYINPVYEKAAINHFLTGDLYKKAQLQNINYILISAESSVEFREWLNIVFGDRDVRELKNKSYTNYNDESQSTVLVYDMTDVALGTAWFANQVSYYNDETPAEQIYVQINEPSTDLSELVFVNKNSITSGNELEVEAKRDKQEIEVLNYGNNFIEMDIETDANSILVTSEIFYPGWKVLLDGEEHETLEVNYAFRGVYVEKGNHKIEFIYEPLDFRIGLAAGVVACIILLAAVVCGISSIYGKRKPE